MRTAFLPAFLSVVLLTLLTACGSSKGVLSGDFTEYEGAFDGVAVELSYYSRLLEEPVVFGSGVVEEDTLKVDLSYDEKIPRWAYVSIRHPDPERVTLSGRSLIIERGTHYTLDVVDESDFLFRVESEGVYAHLFVRSKEVELEERELQEKLERLRQQAEIDRLSGSHPPDEDDSSSDTEREPSVHARVLDWENMNCTDYAGEYERSWRSRFFNPNLLEESEAINEARKQLDEFYEREYDQYVRTLLDSSTDPIEQLLLIERGFSIEEGELVQIFTELESELPDHVVEERVELPLTRFHRQQERRLAYEALKLGTLFPSVAVTLMDQSTTSLSSILQKNTVVLLDLWDNYCLTCLVGLERYRSFYPDFVDQGFEIVSLSIEDNQIDWIERSEELNFPWTNAHAPDGSDGQITKLLGVRYPRANYLLNSEGCILKRNLTPDELLDFLGARLGS
ncbi:MAG: redoxin domain-containing protein [Gammaproteobacteria bacterium]|nr:redoxin domain-containing protein [Gammaproteobacteria bacterium]